MADLLTHVLVPFVLLTVASWRIDIDRHWIPVAMGGAAIPDLVKIGIVLDANVIEGIFGVPFSYGAISSLGGVLVIAAGIAVLFDTNPRRAYLWLVAGGLTSLVLDGLRAYADGQAGFWLFPIWWRPPTPSLYVTSDARVLAIALVLSAIVFGIDYFVMSSDEPIRANLTK